MLCVCETRPRSLLVGADADVSQDLWHLSFCRGTVAAAVEPADILQPSERLRLRDYVAKYFKVQSPKCAWEDLAVHLSDAPATGWTTWSMASQKVPTYRKSGGLMYFPAHRRHLLLREMYLSMGYLTFDVSHFPYASHAYRVFVPGLTWNDMKGALGNAMHVAQVGSFAGSLLLCSRRRQDDFTLAQLLELCDSSM